jgi:large subunit ribosomal protein L17
MRHRVKGRKLGRTAAHRRATLRALATALIKEHKIQTTVPKAKELRTFVEPLITRSKEDSTHNRRTAFAALNDKYAVTALFEEIAPKVGDRPGGYTRIIKSGFRAGDGGELAIIELVDFNELGGDTAAAGGKKKRTRRAGKSTAKTADDAPAKKTEKAEKEEEATEAVAEEVEETKAETKEEATEETVAEAEVEETKAEVEAEEVVAEETEKTEEATEEVKAEETSEEEESDTDKKSDEAK